MKFSEKLTELRHSRGWSQEQLGERLGVTRQTVSKWELGSTTPELEKLAMMSDIFGVSTDELIKGEPQEASRPSEPSEPAEAIQDTKPLRSRLHFEYKSRRTVRGLPLVHINFGAGSTLQREFSLWVTRRWELLPGDSCLLGWFRSG